MHILEEVKRGGIRHYETVRIRKDGRRSRSRSPYRRLRTRAATSSASLPSRATLPSGSWRSWRCRKAAPAFPASSGRPWTPSSAWMPSSASRFSTRPPRGCSAARRGSAWAAARSVHPGALSRAAPRARGGVWAHRGHLPGDGRLAAPVRIARQRRGVSHRGLDLPHRAGRPAGLHGDLARHHRAQAGGGADLAAERRAGAARRAAHRGIDCGQQGTGVVHLLGRPRSARAAAPHRRLLADSARKNSRRHCRKRRSITWRTFARARPG